MISLTVKGSNSSKVGWGIPKLLIVLKATSSCLLIGGAASITNATCKLQAQVFLQDHTLFKRRCTAPEERKAGILKAALDGSYGGFHHLPGRNLCPTCECKKHQFNYHYRFELTFVSQILGITDDTERDRLHHEALCLGMPSYTLSCALCPSCALRSVSAMRSESACNLEVVEIDFYPR